MAGKSRTVLADDRGMALLATIMIISLLIVVTFEFGKAMRQNYLAAANLKNGEQLGAIARSGINLATAILAKDGKTAAFDSLLDDWAGVELADLTGLFDQGQLQLKVADLSGRLQINSLSQSGAVGTGARETLSRLLLSGQFAVENDIEAKEIVDALVDWLDADDQESESGAENSYYASLSPGYLCQNGPVQFVEELQLVKGVTPALLYGIEGKEPLLKFVTVYGNDGKINLNTAEPELLQALNPLVTKELAAAMDEFRREKGNEALLADPLWYKNVPSWPGDINFDEERVTVTSSYFSLEATGVLDTLKRRIVAVVRRGEQGRITELTRKVE